jgi:carboxyl-terminal processing protease
MRKKLITAVGIISAVVLILGIFTFGVIVGHAYLPLVDLPFLPTEPSQAQVSELPPDHPPLTEDDPQAAPDDDLFDPFWEAWDIVHEQYIDQPVDQEALMRGAISGMMDALGDPHSSYMNPEQYEQANIPMQGNYEGIGAWVDPTGDYLEIISPMPGSPAEEAGLKPGDIVLAIDGEDMTGIDGNLVIKKVMGPAGSDVTLTIQRESRAEPFNVTVTREEITVPSVDHRMIEGENLGYIQIITFGSSTRSELKDALREILNENPAGLIVDLRNNGGGFLQTSIEVASEFIADGVILYEDYGYDQGMQTYEAIRGGLATDIPLVVLVNQGSASASEIVAGAIQDRERGPLVGMTTFGKGSVQNWIELNDNQGAVRVTIARWLTPDKRQIHEQGLTPEYEVELTEEDVEQEQDPQLDKAIEVLKDLIQSKDN